MNGRKEGKSPDLRPFRSSSPGKSARPLPELTPRIPRSRDAAAAGIHAAMPGRRDPLPEVAVPPGSRGVWDRKPPPWARPPPAVRRSRAVRLGTRHPGTGSLRVQGPVLRQHPCALPPLHHSAPPPCPPPCPTLHPPPRSTSRSFPLSLETPPRSLALCCDFSHPSAPCALGGTSLPPLIPTPHHRQFGFSTEEFGFLSPEKGS